MTKRRRIDIWLDGDFYRARFTFDYDLIDFFRNLPLDDRSFDKETKTWGFSPRFLRETVLTSRQLKFDDVVVWPDGQAPPPRPKKKKMGDLRRHDDHLIVDFVRLIPREAMLSAYRKAALLLHPDCGGNTQHMQKLNEIWEQLEKSFYSESREA